MCTALYCLSLLVTPFRTAAEVVFTVCQGGTLVAKVVKGGVAHPPSTNASLPDTDAPFTHDLAKSQYRGSTVIRHLPVS